MTLKSQMHWFFPKKQEGILDKDIALTLEEKFSGKDADIVSSLGREPIQNSVDSKLDENDFVTLADKKAEEEISNRLIISFPDIKIIGEEGFFLNKSNPVKYNEKFYWTVDPIDGTKNYIKGDQNFCSMISLI